MFSSISIYNIIRHQIFQIPKVIFLLISSTSSFRRIKDYLATEEINQDCISYHNCDCDSNFDSENSSEFINCIDSDSGDTLNFKRSSVTVSDASLWWKYDSSSSSPTLNNISFSAKQGELVAVSGITGAGKSSLLISLLGEMYKSKGTIQINGKIAYTSQQPWLLNSTILENITFGNKVDHDFFQKVIRVCGLEDDLKSFADGELTVVGENGAKLSGGQRARVSIARAVYSRADLYLFDDPLAALDSKMAYSLFDKVFGQNGILKNRTRIISTNNISFLNRFDSVIVLQNGNIVEQGKVDELSKNHGILASMISDYHSDQRYSLSKNLSSSQNNSDNEDPHTNQVENIDRISKNSNKLGVYLNTPRSSINNESRKSISTLSLSDASIMSFNSTSNEYLDSDGNLIGSEEFRSGSVDIKYKIDYFKTCGFIPIALFILSSVINQYFSTYSTTWIKLWAKTKDSEDNLGSSDAYYFTIYLLVGLMTVLFGGLKSFFLQCVSAINASKKYHEKILNSVIHSPMPFFYSTPVGRILNRFTNDMSVLDLEVHISFGAWIILLLQILFSAFAILSELPSFIFIAIPSVGIYLVLQYIFLNASRNLKRLESTSKSPIYQHFKETLEGISIIRSYHQSKRFELENIHRLDLSQRAVYSSLSLNRWLSLRLEIFASCLLFSISIIFLFTFYSSEKFGFIDASTAGSTIIFAQGITSNLNYCIRMYCKFETDSVAIERINEYSEITSEQSLAANEGSSQNAPENWPEHGDIKFNNYSCTYSSDLPPVLSNLNLHIKAGEKVGVVGRTGAGKSSFSLTLFRAIEALSGSITIDGIDIKNIELSDLRSRLSIIPQEPSIFYGSVRFNLCPFTETGKGIAISDEELWNSLELANLKPLIMAMDGGLDADLLSEANNISIGQRQQLCLARAIIRKSQIIILDEATAAIDSKTDNKIQLIIKDLFANKTVITIAHKINTIMDYDRVIVLKNGSIIEAGKPSSLVNDTSSEFYSFFSA
ncbi:Metal resistance protein YCF1 [Smittium culicis]|uniref:Metal resistance protein YCF1 n=1 Tax=Smittium culicis TaxID=133412 RepID=A0A1R1XU49_9FUNG|nr:Metal resistance protein YCF1 [Smittium culicis]